MPGAVGSRHRIAHSTGRRSDWQTAIYLQQWPGPDSLVVGTLSVVLVLGIEFSSLSGTDCPVWYPHIGVWILACVAEASIGAIGILSDPSGTREIRQPHRIWSLDRPGLCFSCTFWSGNIFVLLQIGGFDR